MQAKQFRNLFIDWLYTEMKLSIETLMQKVKSVVLETDELESQEKLHMNASIGFFSQSNFRWEQ